MNTTTALVLENVAQNLNLMQFLPTAFTAVLTITAYVDLINFEDTSMPYVHLSPEHSLGFPAEEDKEQHQEATRRSYQFSGNRLRSSILVIAYGSKKPRFWQQSRACYGTNNKELLSDLSDDEAQVCQSYVTYNNPNPFRHYSYNFGPRHVLLMVEDGSPAMRHFVDFEVPMRLFFKEMFIANFVAENLKPMLYLIGYDISGLEDTAAPAVTSMTLVCPSCKIELSRSCYRGRFLNEDSEPDEGYRQHWLQLSHKSNYWDDMREAEMTASNGGRSNYWLFGNYNPINDPEFGTRCTQHHALTSARRIWNFGETIDQISVTLFPPEANLTESNLQCEVWTCNRLVMNGFNVRNYLSFYELMHWNGLEVDGNDYVFVTDHLVNSMNEAVSLYTSTFGKWVWFSFPSAILVSCALWTLMLRADVETTFRYNFWRVFSFLAAYLVDQCPNDVPLLVPARARTRLRIVTFGWMITILVISNGYRGFLKANFMYQFAFTSTLSDWHNFSDFALYLLEPDSACPCRDRAEGFVDEAVILWEASGRPSALENCFENNKPIRLRYGKCFGKQNDVFLQHHTDFGNWLERYEFQKHNEYLQWVCTEDMESEEFIECTTKDEANSVELESIVWMSDAIDSVCPDMDKLRSFWGSNFTKKVERWRETAMEMGHKPWMWETELSETKWFGQWCESKHLSFQNGDVRFQKDYEAAYWMTRRTKSAFVVHKSEFPWYWNLFKKAMFNERTLRFAHAGASQLRHYSKSALYNRNDAPFFLYAKERYSESAKWTQRRVAAIQEAGIVNFWHKWDKILRPPRFERLNEEVSEEYSEVRPLKVEDPAIALVMLAVCILLSAAVAIFAIEESVFLIF